MFTLSLYILGIVALCALVSWIIPWEDDWKDDQ